MMPNAPQNGGIGLMGALNVASLAVVTSLGVTYFLDKFKEKKDEVIRNELKDRLYSTL